MEIPSLKNMKEVVTSMPFWHANSSPNFREEKNRVFHWLMSGPVTGFRWLGTAGWELVTWYQWLKSTLQMKGRWESNINVRFPFTCCQKWNCYFQNRIIMFCLRVPSLIYLWEIYIFTGSVCLFCCRELCGPIWGIYKSLIDTWIWKLGLRPCNSQKRKK
jgi:hypothetical protein